MISARRHVHHLGPDIRVKRVRRPRGGVEAGPVAVQVKQAAPALVVIEGFGSAQGDKGVVAIF